MIRDGQYRVTRVLTDKGLVAPPEGIEPNLEVEGDRVAGHAGCNRYMGAINEDGSFGPLASTMMACVPDIMEFEQSFLGLLSRVDTHQQHTSKLVLLDGGTALIELVDATNLREPKTAN